jgi:hypothetical protein
MAPVNLGSIKFKWKGTYAGGTAYTIDDVVSYNGSSYICIQASTGNLPTDTAYFEQMSSAGTNGTDGTDLTTTLTTQGDLVYRNASGLARLGAGTSGQALITGGAGANPSWGDVSNGKLLQVQNFLLNHTSSATTTSTSFQDSLLTDQITPSATSSKILIMVHLNGHRCHDTNANSIITVKRAISGGSTTDIGGNQAYRLAHTYVTQAQMTAFFVYDSPNTTSAIDYTVQWKTDNAAHAAEIFRHTGASTITLMEIGA